jgi:hypothetical protein
MTYRLLGLVLASVLVAACATGRRLPDSGPHDAAIRLDAGAVDGARADAALPVDAAMPGIDAATIDAALPDAARPDASMPAVDAGRDAGSGRCTGIDCSRLTTGCFVGVCVPSTGACTAMRVADGMSCNDGNACTSGDACTSGTCTGAATDCSALTGVCGTGVCDTTTGGCRVMPVADGTSCGAPTGCSAPVCSAGVCAVAPTSDCGSCGGGMVCSGGTCGAPPTSLTYDFESGTIPGGWTNGVGGTMPWTSTTSRAHGGTHSIRSGVIGNSAQSRVSLSITLSSSATVSFSLSTDTESCCDHLQFFVDGVMSGQWQGSTAWTTGGAALAAGTHTLEWRYVKDGSIATGMDAVWIDDLVFALPGDPNTGFEGSTSLPPGYATSGTLPWVVDTSMPHTGSNAAASGVITHSQTSSMTRAAAPSTATTLTFWYRVESESCCDHLYVFDNGVQIASYQGNVPWTMASFPLTAGSHTIEWRYSKDGSISTGLDRAFVDDIDFGFTPPVTGPLCGG